MEVHWQEVQVWKVQGQGQVQQTLPPEGRGDVRGPTSAKPAAEPAAATEPTTKPLAATEPTTKPASTPPPGYLRVRLAVSLVFWLPLPRPGKVLVDLQGQGQGDLRGLSLVIDPQ